MTLRDYQATRIPSSSTLHVRYVFAAEAYAEWVGSQLDDVMEILGNGVTCAYVPGATTPVSIKAINNGTNCQ